MKCFLTIVMLFANVTPPAYGIMYEYDSEGRVVEEFNPYSFPRIVRYEYDSFDRVTLRSSDFDGDGDLDKMETWEYGNGFWYRYSMDSDGNGVFEYSQEVNENGDVVTEMQDRDRDGFWDVAFYSIYRERMEIAVEVDRGLDSSIDYVFVAEDDAGVPIVQASNFCCGEDVFCVNRDEPDVRMVAFEECQDLYAIDTQRMIGRICGNLTEVRIPGATRIYNNDTGLLVTHSGLI